MRFNNLLIGLNHLQEDAVSRDRMKNFFCAKKFLNRCICSRLRKAMMSLGILRSARRISDQA